MRKIILNSSALDILVFFALLFLAVLRGYVFCGGDMDTYIPFILHEHDPSLFKNELLLGTLGSHPVYIWKAMAVFLKWMSIQRLIQCAFIVQTVVIGGGAFLLFRRFFGAGRGWMLFLLMLVVPVTSGGYGVYGLNPYGYFHAGALAFGVVLLAYVLIDGGRWISGGMLTGMVFLFHPVTAVYGAAFFGIRAVMGIVQTKSAWRIVVGGALLMAISFPSLVPAFHTFLTGGAGQIDALFWRAIARFRMNHGYFISAWVPDRFLQIAGCYVALFLAFRKHPAFVRLVPIMLAVAGGLALAAIGDFFNVRLLLRLQPGRCSYFIYFLVTAFVAGALTDPALWQAGRKTRNLWNFAALVGLVLVGNAALSGQPHAAKNVITILLVLSIAVVVYRFFRAVRPGIVFAGIAAIVVASTLPRSGAMVNWTMAQSLRDPWVQIACWCGKTVGKDDIIMTPLDKQDFRPWSLRATYCSWKDGAPHLFCDTTLPVWWRRMRKFGVTLSSKMGGFPGLYRDRAIDVARSEGIRYVIFNKQFDRYSGPVAYENSGYGVIDLNGWNGYRLEKNN